MPNYSGSSSVQPVSAGYAAPWQTAKTYTGKQATSTSATTTVTLETVTSGKSFYITDIMIATDVASGTQILDCQIQAAGTTIFRGPTHNLSPITLPGLETQPFGASTQVVTLLLPQTSSGAVNVYFYIAGFEQ